MPSPAARAIQPGVSARSRYIARVYAHLFGAVVALVAFEVALFRSGAAARISAALHQVSWPLVLGAFLVIAWLASRMAWRLDTLAGQYAGLAVYVVAKGLIMVPLLHHAERVAPGVIEQAAQTTVLGFAGLTAVAFVSRQDFSFLRPLLIWGGFLALLMIAAAFLFGLRLGTWFNLGMVGLAGAAILYDTAKIARRFHNRRHVAAALSLFASIGMMFWHLLRYLTKLRR